MKLSAATPRPSSRELTHKSGPPEPSTSTRPKTGPAARTHSASNPDPPAATAA